MYGYPRLLPFLIHSVPTRRSSDLCIADDVGLVGTEAVELRPHRTAIGAEHADLDEVAGLDVRRQIEGPRHMVEVVAGRPVEAERRQLLARRFAQQRDRKAPADMRRVEQRAIGAVVDIKLFAAALRSEEHTSELQSLMRNSYAVFCLKKKKTQYTKHITT